MHKWWFIPLRSRGSWFNDRLHNICHKLITLSLVFHITIQWSLALMKTSPINGHLHFLCLKTSPINGHLHFLCLKTSPINGHLHFSCLKTSPINDRLDILKITHKCLWFRKEGCARTLTTPFSCNVYKH